MYATNIFAVYVVFTVHLLLIYLFSGNKLLELLDTISTPCVTVFSYSYFFNMAITRVGNKKEVCSSTFEATALVVLQSDIEQHFKVKA